MVTIVKGNQTLTVTKGAYNEMYASQGWEIRTRETGVLKDDLRTVSKNRVIIPTQPQKQNLDNPTQQYEDIFDEPEVDDMDLSEIPISEMSVPQLKLYGKQLGVEVNTDSAKTLRNRIRKVLEG